MNNRPSIKKLSGISIFLMCFYSLSYADHNEELKEKFWGQLYKDGGISFYCKEPFTSKTPLISESYIYSSSWITDHLQCGTKRQCNKDSPQYHKIMSDLHNLVVADAYLEFKRKNSVFGEADESAPIIKCNIRKGMHDIEPPDNIKGDIARTIFYMHQQYQLPLLMSYSLLMLWHQTDAPSPEELARNKRIKEIQGNENPYITNPNLVHTLEH